MLLIYDFEKCISLKSNTAAGKRENLNERAKYMYQLGMEEVTVS